MTRPKVTLVILDTASETCAVLPLWRPHHYKLRTTYTILANAKINYVTRQFAAQSTLSILTALLECMEKAVADSVSRLLCTRAAWMHCSLVSLLKSAAGTLEPLRSFALGFGARMIMFAIVDQEEVTNKKT